MKSPTNSVGIIEPDGMRNGSATNARRISTINNTGKNDFEYSTYHGSLCTADRACAPPCSSRAASFMRRLKKRRSMSIMPPVNMVPLTSNISRSRFIIFSALLFHLQHGKKGLLRYLHPADLLHAFLARLLFFKQLALASNVSTVALGDDVFA